MDESSVSTAASRKAGRDALRARKSERAAIRAQRAGASKEGNPAPESSEHSENAGGDAFLSPGGLMDFLQSQGDGGDKDNAVTEGSPLLGPTSVKSSGITYNAARAAAARRQWYESRGWDPDLRSDNSRASSEEEESDVPEKGKSKKGTRKGAGKKGGKRSVSVVYHDGGLYPPDSYWNNSSYWGPPPAVDGQMQPKDDISEQSSGDEKKKERGPVAACCCSMFSFVGSVFLTVLCFAFITSCLNDLGLIKTGGMDGGTGGDTGGKLFGGKWGKTEDDVEKEAEAEIQKEQDEENSLMQDVESFLTTGVLPFYHSDTTKVPHSTKSDGTKNSLTLIDRLEVEKKSNPDIDDDDDEISKSKSQEAWGLVVGLDSQKVKLRGIMESVAQPELHDIVSPPTGVLLYGPPGTGKTYLAEAMAGAGDFAFHAVKSSDIKTKWHGQTGERLALAFKTAKKLANKKGGCVLFIDEIDTLLPRKDGGGAFGGAGDDEIINEFLQATAGVGSTSVKSKESGRGVVLVVGATNFPWRLHDSVLSRLSEALYVPLPKEKDIETLIRKELQGKIDASKLWRERGRKLLTARKKLVHVAQFDNFDSLQKLVKPFLERVEKALMRLAQDESKRRVRVVFGDDELLNAEMMNFPEGTMPSMNITEFLDAPAGMRRRLPEDELNLVLERFDSGPKRRTVRRVNDKDPNFISLLSHEAASIRMSNRDIHNAVDEATRMAKEERDKKKRELLRRKKTPGTSTTKKKMSEEDIVLQLPLVITRQMVWKSLEQKKATTISEKDLKKFDDYSKGKKDLEDDDKGKGFFGR